MISISLPYPFIIGATNVFGNSRIHLHEDAILNDHMGAKSLYSIFI